MPANQLRIRGSKNGIIIQFEGGDLRQKIASLEDKLQVNPHFFTGTHASIIFPKDADLDSKFLAQLFNVLEKADVKLNEIRRQDTVSVIEVPTTPAAEPSVNPKLHWVERRLRSGEKLVVDGDLVLLGDVNPGAEVSATGNILVWGCLQGVAHAGRGGFQDARIMALKMKATQLRIAGYISRAPDEVLEPGDPEVARIGSSGIIIETWEKVGKEPIPFWQRLLHGREVKL